MSHSLRIAIACGIAVLATGIGWSQTWVYKTSSLEALALWFPLVVIFRLNETAGIAVSLIQFPAFALVFAVATRRWSIARVLAVLALTYVSFVAIALAIARLN